jgi:hypothetical protein
LWGKLMERRNDLAQINKTLTHCRIGHGVHKGSIELGNRLLGRSFGSSNPIPGRKIKSR